MSGGEFVLHPRLAADTFAVGDLPLCRLLMMNDAQYPWFILVPKRHGIREIHELSVPDQQQLLAESSLLGRELMRVFNGTKLNVAALGNVVPQLHLHHIVRLEDDPAWPAPVWSRHPPLDYEPAVARKRIARLVECLPPDFKAAAPC